MKSEVFTYTFREWQHDYKNYFTCTPNSGNINIKLRNTYDRMFYTIVKTIL